MVTKLLSLFVRLLPRFLKTRLERLVFMNETENLPPPDEPAIGILLGGDSSRVGVAEALLRAGIIDVIMISGGIGKFSENRKVPEAVLYEEELVRRGVSRSSIWTEIDSKNTFENARNCVSKLARFEARHWKNLVLITNNYHLTRSIGLFRHQMALWRYPGNLFWVGCKSRYAERENWRFTEKGRALVLKEGLRILEYRLFKRI